MNINEYISNTYKLIKYLNEKKNIMLVESNIDHKFYVLKIVKAYDRNVYDYLKTNPVKGIPGIYEIMEDEQALYVVEEYIDGITVDLYFDRPEYKENNAEWMIINVINNICTILHSLHNSVPPIIHRDIKPQNILITAAGDIRLIDFNISREYTGNAEKDTIAMGTKGFASPEQHGFMESDQRSDIYSLGATVKYLTELTKTKSEKLEAFIEKATAYNREERFQNVVEAAYFIKHFEEPDIGDEFIRRNNTNDASWKSYEVYQKKKLKNKNIIRLKIILFIVAVMVVLVAEMIGVIFTKHVGDQESNDSMLVVFVMSIIFLIMLGAVYLSEKYKQIKLYSNLIAITPSIEAFEGKSQKTLSQELRRLGFTNIKAFPIKENSSNKQNQGYVVTLTIDGVQSPKEGMEFISDAVITITYY